MYQSKRWQYQVLQERPLVGYAPDIGSSDAEESSLCFLSLTWRDLEPKEEEFAFVEWEQRLGFSHLRQQGQRLVFRLVLDRPGFENACGLPDWLLQRVPAQAYRSPFGRGLAPDYHHPYLAAAYQRLVLALGKAWGQDGLVAYLELGGLGHWGEWHQLANLGPLPQGEFAQRFYVDPWLAAFRDCHFCLRRPFAWLDWGKSYDFYHDELGDLPQTRVWLEELERGGPSFDGAQMCGLGQSSVERVLGGEWSSNCLWAPPGRDLLAQIRGLGLSFLGPALPQNPETFQAVAACLGYQIWLPQVQFVSSLLGTCLILTWENRGVAAFPFSWPVYLRWETWQGELGRTRLSLDLTQLLAGQRRRCVTWLSRPLLAYKSLILSVEDPLTKKPFWIFSQKGKKWAGGLLL